MKLGQFIKVDGKRPEGLHPEDQVYLGGDEELIRTLVKFTKWGVVQTFRLPEDHPYYAAATLTPDKSHENLLVEAKKDNFKQESPIRGFTDWQIDGLYAVGRGFRPAMIHLAVYLNAMEAKEGWRMIQIIEGSTNPTFIFRKVDT